MFSLFGKVKTGLEISADEIKAISLFKKGGKKILNNIISINIPPGAIKPSFKQENILDEKAVQDCLEKVRADINSNRASVALPDSSVKVLIQKFRDLPVEDHEIDKMVNWNVSSILKIPAEEFRISWEYMGIGADNQQILLVVLGIDRVLDQYEKIFKRAGIRPLRLIPAGLSQFNFYSHLLPESGTIAFLRLFDDVLSLFVFVDHIPVLYKTVKKGLLGDDEASAINDVDFLMQYYKSEHPDFPVDNFYISSPIKSSDKLKRILSDIQDSGVEILEEEKLIDLNKLSEKPVNKESLPFYSAVIGAACEP